ncbi:MAG: YicC/YloC family endoribonuclease [Planctomycetota bacterium]
MIGLWHRLRPAHPDAIGPVVQDQPKQRTNERTRCVIRSMTGYGEASDTVEGVHYFLQIRTLNGKYFKTTVRLQDEFEALEADLESALKRRIARGTASIKASCTDETASAAFQVNTAAFDRYIEQLNASEHVASGRVQIGVDAILALPGVLQPPGDEDARVSRVREVFLRLVEEAADQLIARRESEGQLLAADLLLQLEAIESNLADVRARAPGVVAEYEQRLRTRIEQYVADAGAPADPADITREIAGYAERTDIAEEIVRLTGHVEQFRAMVRSEDSKPVGRTLDFMAQEMLREANTMSSKSLDSELTRSVVAIKGAIDRIKEQVQNAE